MSDCHGEREAEEELEEREFPDEDDDLEDDEGEEATFPCPECRGAVYEDAEHCPSCGHYLSREERRGRPRWWVVAGALICLVVVLLAVVR